MKNHVNKVSKVLNLLVIFIMLAVTSDLSASYSYNFSSTDLVE